MPHHDPNLSSTYLPSTSGPPVQVRVQHGVPLPNEILVDIFLWLLDDTRPSTTIREIHESFLCCMLTCREWHSMVQPYLEW